MVKDVSTITIYFWNRSFLEDIAAGIMTRLFTLLFLAALLLCAHVATADEYRYGAEQLAKFADSRKEAAVHLETGTQYYRFLERAFEGLYTSVPLIWDSAEPQGNAYAENTPNDERTRIIIRVSSELPPLDQIAALIYECKNAQNEQIFGEYIQAAYMGNLTKTEFIHNILRLEHKKLKETRAFLTVQYPFSDMDPSRTEFYRRMLHTPENFDAFLDYLHRIKREEYDVFDMYSRFYDFITMTPLKRKAQLDAEKKARQEEEARVKKIREVRQKKQDEQKPAGEVGAADGR